MKVLVLIVTFNTREMTSLCVRSVRKNAPGTDLIVVDNGSTDGTVEHLRQMGVTVWCYANAPVGASGHAHAIEWFRGRLDASPDYIVLLDSDSMVLSPEWLPRLLHPFADPKVGATGGLRNRGDASQLFVDELPILHASCLAMRREVFYQTSTFEAELDPIVGVYVMDTAARVSLELAERGQRVHMFPYFRVGHGPTFPGLQIGEYFDPEDPARQTLWCHAWRGTSMRPEQGLARLRRRLAVLLRRPYSTTFAIAQERHNTWLARVRQLVEDPPHTR